MIVQFFNNVLKGRYFLILSFGHFYFIFYFSSSYFIQMN